MEFGQTQEVVKGLEKKTLAYAPYNQDMQISQTLDLEPKEYIDFSYDDLLNLYERTQKIISAAGLVGKITAATGEMAAPAGTKEVENKLRQITTETLEKAQEVRPVMELEEKSVPIDHQIEIEREERAVDFEPEMRQKEEKAEVPELETGEKGIKREEAIEKEPGMPSGRPEIKQEVTQKPPMPEPVSAVPLPSILKAGEAGTKRYDQIEEKVMAALGGATDQISLKKRMLELTKELFKEKSTARREEIKLEITVLKNMLAGTAGAKKKVGETEARSSMLDTIISAQQSEISQIKDSVVESYRKQMGQMKEKFMKECEVTDDESGKKKAFEAFTSEIVSLAGQLPDSIKNYQEFLVKKHSAELEKLGETGDKTIKAKAEERMSHIKENYETELSSLKDIIGKEIDSIIETTGSKVFYTEKTEGSTDQVISEINSMDDGSLLHLLLVKDAKTYEKYEKKKISKVEAIVRAKALIAKEKKVSEKLVRKYFSTAE